MLLSGQYNFLFISIPKAASTTIRRSLWHLSDITLMDSPYVSKSFNPHSTFIEVRSSFDKLDFDSFFKFCVVRNPVDRLISTYNYRKREILQNTNHPRHSFSTRNLSIDQFLEDIEINKVKHLELHQHHYIYSEYIDVILKMEDIPFAKNIFPLKFAFMSDALVKGFEKVFNPSGTNYYEHNLTQPQIKRIETIFLKDFELYETTNKYRNFEKLYSSKNEEQSRFVKNYFEQYHFDIYVENLRGNMKYWSSQKDHRKVRNLFYSFCDKYPKSFNRLLSIYINILWVEKDWKEYVKWENHLNKISPVSIDDHIALIRYNIKYNLLDDAESAIKIAQKRFGDHRGLLFLKTVIENKKDVS